MARKKPDTFDPSTSAETLSAHRGRTHGQWIKQAELEKRIKHAMRQGTNWDSLEASQSQALEGIALKMSRILEGNQYYHDHWDDIAGYALLGKINEIR